MVILSSQVAMVTDAAPSSQGGAATGRGEGPSPGLTSERWR
jgi:hypothetical protein